MLVNPFDIARRLKRNGVAQTASVSSISWVYGITGSFNGGYRPSQSGPDRTRQAQCPAISERHSVNATGADRNGEWLVARE
jgi:hypothetical protein